MTTSFDELETLSDAVHVAVLTLSTESESKLIFSTGGRR